MEYKNIDGKEYVEMTKEEWRKEHKDYKGYKDGVPHVVTRNGLMPVKIIKSH